MLLILILILILIIEVKIKSVVIRKRARNFVEFWRNANKEVKKVVWPSSLETLQLTIRILVIALFVSLVIWLIDALLKCLLRKGEKDWSFYG